MSAPSRPAADWDDDDGRPPVQYGASPALPGAPPEDEGPQDLHPCASCGRSFTLKALERHMGICQKVFQSKRKEFNAKKQWLPEDAEKAKPSMREQRKVEKELEDQKKKNDWKAKSEAFREQIRYNKMVTQAEQKGESLAALPLPPQQVD